MGVIASVGFADFPRQGTCLGKRTEVCFKYDTENTIGGKIVRDDMEHPFRTIIALDDGRFIEACECQYSFLQ